MEKKVDDFSQNRNKKTPLFINSAPRGVDLFEGQSQEQIAESVSHLIITHQIENRLIGLDGMWGSGKSNLVKIIESKLKDTHHVFYYDAWGHQEDLQRRAFLEELTADLCNSGLIENEKWTQKLKDLLARKRETLTTSIPRLSNGIIVTIAIAIFTPIAKSVADSIHSQIAKISVTALPFIFGLIIWLVASCKARKRLGLQEIYRLYKEKDLINETYVTISEKEPSVREFQRWMKELSEALRKKELIVIFDNMDRLPPDKVRELWSSIHTFFAEGSFDHIWVVIPFDRKRIVNAFENNDEVSEKFLRKSLSIIYRVPLPVLTDWQKFLRVKYEEAFGDSQDEEFNIIRSTFDLLQDQITPRSIIAFINEMVSLRLAVDDNILLRYIAIFVLAKKAILEEPINQILSLEFLKKASLLYKQDKNLQNQIAALVYHVPLESASQVTLIREIENTLRDKNSKRFNELAMHPHFIDILEQVIAGEDRDITNSTATLAMLDDEFKRDKEKNNRIQNIWDSLCAKQLANPVSEQLFTPTQALLLMHSSQNKRLTLAEYIVKGIRNVEMFSGAGYYLTLARLESYLNKNKIKVSLTPMLIDIEKSPEVFIDYIKTAGSDYKKYKLKCNESALMKFIIKKVPNELTGMSAISVAKSELNFEPVIACLEEEIQENTINADNCESFYEFYKSIASEKPIKPIVDDQIHVLLTQVEEESEAQLELLAMRLARTNKFPNFSGITQTILSETNEGKVRRIAERVEYYANYGELLEVCVSWTQPLLKAVLRELTLNSYGSSKMSITNVLKQFERLHTYLEIAPEELINKLNRWSKHAKKEITSENVIDVIPDSEFFKHSIEMECDLTRLVNAKMVEFLNSQRVEDWTKPLREPQSYLFDVAYWLLKGGQLSAVPDNAVAVYKELLIEAAKDKFTMDVNDGWDVFYERTHKSKLKATAKNIRDLFISEVRITPDKFIMFADMLLNHANLRQKSDDVARKILAPVVDNDTCLELMVANEKFFIPLIIEAGDDADDLIDIIRTKVLGPESSKNLIRFAKALGIA